MVASASSSINDNCLRIIEEKTPDRQRTFWAQNLLKKTLKTSEKHLRTS
jgi:hypothetical protein